MTASDVVTEKIFKWIDEDGSLVERTESEVTDFISRSLMKGELVRKFDGYGLFYDEKRLTGGSKWSIMSLTPEQTDGWATAGFSKHPLLSVSNSGSVRLNVVGTEMNTRKAEEFSVIFSRAVLLAKIFQSTIDSHQE